MYAVYLLLFTLAHELRTANTVTFVPLATRTRAEDVLGLAYTHVVLLIYAVTLLAVLGAPRKPKINRASIIPTTIFLKETVCILLPSECVSRKFYNRHNIKPTMRRLKNYATFALFLGA